MECLIWRSAKLHSSHIKIVDAIIHALKYEVYALKSSILHQCKHKSQHNDNIMLNNNEDGGDASKITLSKCHLQYFYCSAGGTSADNEPKLLSISEKEMRTRCSLKKMTTFLLWKLFGNICDQLSRVHILSFIYYNICNIYFVNGRCRTHSVANCSECKPNKKSRTAIRAVVRIKLAAISFTEKK